MTQLQREQVLTIRGLKAAANITLLFIAAAIVYGIAHDLITAHICVEYFTVMHPRIIASESPVALALLWGVVATWWAGLFAGLLVSACARFGRWPKLEPRRVFRWIIRLLPVMAAGALVLGVLGYAAASADLIWLNPEHREGVGAANKDRALAVGAAHTASYLLGFVGSLVIAVLALLARQREAILGTVTPPASPRAA